jgi:hypothetical protein
MRKDKKPDAYGLLDEGDVWYATPFRSEAEGVLNRTGDTDSEIVALYRKPTLTDAEREAIEGMAAYFDTRGNITLQAWGSLLRVLLARLSPPAT